MPCRRRGDYAIAAATANWSGGWCRCTEVMRQKPDSIAVQNAEIRGEDQIERYVENIPKISYPVNLISKINNRNLIVIVRGLIVFFLLQSNVWWIVEKFSPYHVFLHYFSLYPSFFVFF